VQLDYRIKAVVLRATAQAKVVMTLEEEEGENTQGGGGAA
jgi:hypothetical protein